MKTKRMFVIVGVFLATGLLAIPIAECSQQKGTSIDYEALAQKLVNQCANIHEGDLVLVTGGVRDSELLEDIAVHVRKVGAFPLVSLNSERMWRRMLEDVPAKYVSQTPEFDLKLGGLITAQIDVEFVEMEAFITQVPPERFAASWKAALPVRDLMLKRNVRYLYMGNDLYPTAERAKRFGVSQEELSKIFWDGMNADYSQIQATGKAIKAALASGKQLHITNPNGTDLKMEIEGRPIVVSDGVISADAMKTGGAACWVYLPAGEATVAPVPGTAEGKVVIDRQSEIQGLTLTFKAGKLTSMTAKSGLEKTKALYDAAGPGKESFGFVDIGINPDVHLVPGSQMVAYMASGMVTLWMGNNTLAGGENNVNYTAPYFLPGSTVEVDGKVLIEKGVLKF
jgi:leucyl aminopeptidase (aminopeptidase T)